MAGEVFDNLIVQSPDTATDRPISGTAKEEN